MKEEKCKNCIYYNVMWCSSQPHPCSICINMERDLKDNFVSKDYKVTNPTPNENK